MTVSRAILLALIPAISLASDLLQLTVYATAGGVQRYLASPESRRRTAETLRRLEITKVVLEGRRGDEHVSPELLREIRDDLKSLGFATMGGIATVPGKTFGVRQQGPLSWLNWEAEKTQRDIAEYFRTNAPIFDELVIDDFYCTADESAESVKARGTRPWGDYRRDLLTRLIRPMVVEPARRANPRVRLTIKFPQWYDRFHMFGYDPERMPAFFDRVWVGTEVRNPLTRRMGYVQPTEGYINYRWLQSIAGGKVEAAWFDHIECTAQNFIDQAYQSVLAGARELVLFNLGDIVEGHPGHELLIRALPELRKVGQALRPAMSVAYSKPPKVGQAFWPAMDVAYYKPPNSDAGENQYLMDYLAMLGLPIVPSARYPAQSRAAILGLQAAHDPRLSREVHAHLNKGARIATTRELLDQLGPQKGIVLLDLRTFAEHDFRDAGEWLLAPKLIPWLDMPQNQADELRRSLGVDLSAPTRIGLYDFGRTQALYSFRDDDVEVRLNGRTIQVPAHRLVQVGQAVPPAN